jgi:hypothetical protein
VLAGEPHADAENDDSRDDQAEGVGGVEAVQHPVELAIARHDGEPGAGDQRNDDAGHSDGAPVGKGRGDKSDDASDHDDDRQQTAHCRDVGERDVAVVGRERHADDDDEVRDELAGVERARHAPHGGETTDGTGGGGRGGAHGSTPSPAWGDRWGR